MALRPKEALNQRAVGNVGKHIVLYKLADQSYTTQTALQNDTDLVFSIDVNEIWCVKYWIDAGAALATPGFKVSVAVPTSATVNVVAALIPDTVTAANVVVKRSATASATLTFAAAGLGSVGDGLLEITAWIQNSTNAGSVQLQFCQATSSGTAITFRKGSFMDAKKLLN